jgi:hypothetical protein
MSYEVYLSLTSNASDEEKGRFAASATAFIRRKALDFQYLKPIC